MKCKIRHGDSQIAAGSKPVNRTFSYSGRQPHPFGPLVRLPVHLKIVEEAIEHVLDVWNLRNDTPSVG